MPSSDFSDLRALVHQLHPEALARAVATRRRLIDNAARSCAKHGVAVDEVRAVDHDIPPGVQPDMTEHGWATRRVARDPASG